jgi:hypothetical protein
MDFLLPSMHPKHIEQVFRYFELASLETASPEQLNELDYLFHVSPVIQFLCTLLNNGATLDTCYSKKDRHVIRIIQKGIPIEIVLTTKNIPTHASGLDLSVGAMYRSLISEETIIPYPESLQDFEKYELNFLPHRNLHNELAKNPSRFSRVVRAATSSHFSITKKLEKLIHQHIQFRKDIFTEMRKEPSKLADRLYYDLCLLFFSGRAEANFNKLIELNLFDQLFGFIKNLPEETKKSTLSLMVDIVKLIDQNPNIYSPSLIYYAVHWESIKTLSFPMTDVCGLSDPIIHLPDTDLSNIIDSQNRKILEALEEKYRIAQSPSAISLVSGEAESSSDKTSRASTPSENSKTFSDSSHDAIKAYENLSDSFDSYRSSSFDNASPVLEKNSANFAENTANTSSMNLSKKRKSKKTKKSTSKNQIISSEQTSLHEQANNKLKEAENFKSLAHSKVYAYKKLIELCNENKALAQEYQRLYTLYAEEAKNKYEEARCLYQNALNEKPDDTLIISKLEAIVAEPIIENLIQLPEKKGHQNKKSSKKSPKKKKADLSKQIDIEILEYTPIPSNDDRYWIEKAEQYKANKEYQNAADAYSKIITDFQTSPYYLKAHRERIDLNILLKNYLAVLRDCSFLMSITDTNFKRLYQNTQTDSFKNYHYHRCQALFQRATTYAATNIEKEQALRDFDTIIQEAMNFPQDKNFLRLATESHFYLAKNAKRSAGIIRREFSSMPDKSLALKRITALEEGLINHLDNAIHCNRNFYEAYIELVNVFQIKNNLNYAIIHYQNCLKTLKADSSKSHDSAKDEMYQLIIRLTESVGGKLIDKILESPTSYSKKQDKKNNISLLNITRGFYQEAQKYSNTQSQEVTERLTEIDECLNFLNEPVKTLNNERNPEVFFQLAETHKQSGKYREAADNYNITIALDHHHIKAHKARIDVNFLQKEYDLALIHCNVLLEMLEPQSVALEYEYYRTLYQRGIIYFAKGTEVDIEKGMVDFQQVIEKYEQLTQGNIEHLGFKKIAVQSCLQLGRQGREALTNLKNDQAEDLVQELIFSLEEGAQITLRKGLEWDPKSLELSIELEKIALAQATTREKVEQAITYDEKDHQEHLEQNTYSLSSMVGKFGAIQNKSESNELSPPKLACDSF